jgi:hypothetical protein
MALESCDSAFKDSVAKITAVFHTCLIGAKSDSDRTICRDTYRNGLEFSKQVLAESRAIVAELFGNGGGAERVAASLPRTARGRTVASDDRAVKRTRASHRRRR